MGLPHFEAIPDSAGQGFEEVLTGVLDSGEPVVLHEVPIVLSWAHTGRPNTGYYTITGDSSSSSPTALLYGTK